MLRFHMVVGVGVGTHFTLSKETKPVETLFTRGPTES